MTELLGITTDWERRMRAVKRSILGVLGQAPDFTGVYISNDIAEQIQADTHFIGVVGDNTTFEGIPLKVDHDLPVKSVIYIWKETK